MFKKILFSHVTPLIKKGRQRPLEISDFRDVDARWKPQNYRYDFDQLQSSSPHLLKDILKILLPQGKKLLFLIFFILSFKMISPVLIHKLIETVGLASEGKVGILYGVSVALALGMVQLISAILSQHYVYHSVSATQSAVNGLNQRLYRAIIHSRNQKNRGDLINRVSTDAESAGAILWALGELLQIVLTIALTSALLFYYLGSIAFVPLIVLSLLLPVSRFFSLHFAQMQGEIMKARDQRVGKMGQFLDGIKVIKSFVWEKVVEQNINEMRNQEISSWRKLAQVKSLSTGSYLFFSLLVSFASFALYQYQGNTLSAELAFTCITLFSFLEPCFRQLPKILGEISQASVAAKRIAQVLDDKDVLKVEAAGDDIVFKEVNVSLGNKDLLKNVSFEVKAGESVAIVGEVGSGKSTLLKTMLGEYDYQGELNLKREQVSLVTQDPFLFMGSLVENITLKSNDYDQEKLIEALYGASLDEDIRLFPGKEHFQLIENGGNLSGGQRQRVNIARAAYHEADLILLDDPFSALDPRTEDQIVERLLMGKWSLKTRIVTTQRLKHLAKFDKILFLSKGEVLFFGNLQEAKKNCLPFNEFLRAAENSIKEHTPKAAPAVSAPEMGDVQHIKDEETGAGEISFSLYFDYLKAMARFSSKHYWSTVITLVLVSLLTMMLPIVQSKVLSTWTQSAELSHLFLYGGVGLLAVFMGALQHFYWSNKSITAGESLHQRALKSLLSVGMNYFDTNPSGRILNRFSRDLDAVEKDLSWSLEEAFMAFLNTMGAVCVMLFIVPVMLIAVLPVVIIYYQLQKSYRSCMREAKRLMSVSRSPRFSSIQEISAGASVIKTFKATGFFRDRFELALGNYQKAFFGVVLINRWFSIRIPIISSLLSFSAAIAVILLGSQGSISSGLAGLILVYAFRFWDSLNWTVRAFGEAESQMTSVERLNEFSTLKFEAEIKKQQVIREGEIVFKDVFARYAENLPNVLKGASFRVNAGEKVGVIGRTGAGKSTLFSLLHGFIPIEEGEILIDNMSIEGFPLKELRSSISTIPQNPVLFSGTIRSNLDPYGEHSDEELIRVLRKAQIDFLDEGLQSVVFEGGINFSRGQRQLLCLARALVRHAKIIIVDEATASIDAKTDELIRDILMKQCPHITVLIIAHKMESISECDKIIEMGEGRVLSVSSREAAAVSVPA